MLEHARLLESKPRLSDHSPDYLYSFNGGVASRLRNSILQSKNVKDAQKDVTSMATKKHAYSAERDGAPWTSERGTRVTGIG